MDQEVQDKIARLPAWARDLIKRLDERPARLVEETTILRKRITYLEEQLCCAKDRESAMVDIFRGAGRAGNETAKAFVDRVLNEWCPAPEPAEAE